jgi:hypothetical protein
LTAIVFCSSLASRSAFAAGNDAQAAKLREAAIYQDYLATDFPSAEKKLTQALALCEKPADCTAATRGRLHCDLGVVYFASQKADEARAQFAAALKDDPNVTIDADLTTPDLQKEFAAAKAGGGAAGGGAAGGGAAAAPKGGAGAGAPAGGAADENGGGEDESGNDETEEKKPATVTKPSESSDCPPGFPGCKSGEPTSCSNDDDCGAGEKCVDQKCSGANEASGPGKANWVSLAFEADGTLLPQADNVCSGGQGYSCFNPDGTYYKGIPVKGGGGQVLGGFSIATMRILAAYDRVFGNFTLGGALGYTLRTGPTRQGGQASLPIHAELRGKYWIGKQPFGKPGFKFYVLLGGGIAEVDASINAFVNDPMMGNGLTKTAWHKIGTGFAAAGFGLGALVSKNIGVFVEPRAMLLFPTVGEAFAAQLSVQYGF